MKLVPVETVPNHKDILYRLLKERPIEANISHREMPTFERHVAFVKSSPYKAWYLIKVPVLDASGMDVAGSIYLTRNDEIGIAMFERYWGTGYAEEAINTLMRWWGPRNYLANVAPSNGRSINFFKRLGFEMVQHTFVFRPKVMA